MITGISKEHLQIRYNTNQCTFSVSRTKRKMLEIITTFRSPIGRSFSMKGVKIKLRPDLRSICLRTTFTRVHRSTWRTLNGGGGGGEGRNSRDQSVITPKPPLTIIHKQNGRKNYLSEVLLQIVGV